MEDDAKQRVLEILTASFKDNQSIHFVLKQDRKRDVRLRKLIEYAIFYGERFGELYLSEDRNACYITLDTEKKKMTLSSIIWDLKLIFQCIGIRHIKKVLKREALIKSNHPNEGFIHLWYIGVIPTQQNLGNGTRLMKRIIENAKSQNKKIFLETSTESNFIFYENLGFQEEVTLNQLGYSLKMYSIG